MSGRIAGRTKKSYTESLSKNITNASYFDIALHKPPIITTPWIYSEDNARMQNTATACDNSILARLREIKQNSIAAEITEQREATKLMPDDL